MGTRTLRISPAVLIGLCQRRDQKLVTACTENALPDDVEIENAATWTAGLPTGIIELTLRSAEWEGDGGELPVPVIETFDLAIAIEGG